MTPSEFLFNDYLDAILAALFVAVVVTTSLYSVAEARKRAATAKPPWSQFSRRRSHGRRPAMLHRLLKGAVATAQVMVGIPDYDTYVEHRRTLHPAEPIMTTRNFFASAKRRATRSARATSRVVAERCGRRRRRRIAARSSSLGSMRRHCKRIATWRQQAKGPR